MSEHNRYTAEGRAQYQKIMTARRQKAAKEAERREKDAKQNRGNKKPVEKSMALAGSPNLNGLQKIHIPEINAHIYVDKRKNPEKAKEKYLAKIQEGKANLRAKSVAQGTANANKTDETESESTQHEQSEK